MSEYRALRERYSLLELCRTPDLATEVTLQPVRRIEVDAAILFSDLLLPLEPMGINFDFVHGEGPAIENPIRGEEDIDRVRRFEPREALSAGDVDNRVADHSVGACGNRFQTRRKRGTKRVGERRALRG